MNRRTFFAVSSNLLIGTLVAHAAPRKYEQQLVPVRMLVLRRLGLSPTNNCAAPCIRGRIFDVTNVTAGALDETLIPLIGKAQALCDVIERPWANNAPSVSSIPRGQYAATIRDQATKKWMTTENRRWRLELEGTKPRSSIQFHFGQDVSWSEGCFIVGSLRQPDDAKGVTAAYCQVEAGEDAIARIRQAVLATGRNSKDIRIGVADHSGLFPDFTAQSKC